MECDLRRQYNLHMPPPEEHIVELLKLPPPQRTEAVRLLLDSLDGGDATPDAENQRISELLRRARSVVDGRAMLIDGGEARERVLARLRTIRGA